MNVVREQCEEKPICKYKTVSDGAAGKKIIPELVEGQPECMRRCDPKDGMADFCGEDEECYPYVMGCPCPNLNSGEGKCNAWN